ncbi:hypothetical protein HZA33_01925 [Candidatus Pacearchaeota archaeon]|nr:hypothetical protein [Candidatus Pacearchaeota archaeon]
MDTKVLEETGLTKNEIAIYLFLLKKIEVTTGPLIKETAIANSRVYESLNSLIKKGLVTYTIQKEGKKFRAVDPKILLEKEEERTKKLKSIILELLSLKAYKETQSATSIYEGFDGFKTAFKKIIKDCPINGIIYIIGFSKQQYSDESLRNFIANMNLKSAQKKQKLKILIDKETMELIGREMEKQKYTDIRYLPKEFTSPAAIDIFEDYVYIFLWEEKPFVFMIKNSRIAESFKSYFNFLWKIAKK